MAKHLTEKLTTNICGEYDVIVAGGGVAILGGLATAGHIAIYLPLCDGMGNKVIGGIAEELLLESIRYGGGNLPPEWEGRPNRVDTQKRYKTEFNAPAFVLALDRFIGEARVDLLLDTVFCTPVMEEGHCKAVIVENKSGRQAYLCRAVVDATGDADVLTRAGALLKLFFMGDHTGGGLTEGVPKYYGTDVRQVSEFLLKCRDLALEELIKQEKDKLVFASFPSMAQFRTTRWLEGEYVLGPVDLHRRFEDSVGCVGDWRQAGPVYEIPYRTLYSEKVSNILAAGRNISADGDTREVTRVIPAAAALICESDSAADDVDISRLQQILVGDGMLVHNLKWEAKH
jgi:hypothetical protein